MIHDDKQIPDFEFEGPMGKYWDLGDVPVEAIDKAISSLHAELRRRRKQANSKESKLLLCQRCENNFYNGNNDIGVKECWSLDKAKLVMRKQVGLNDVPPWTHQPVIQVLSCCHIKGYVLVEPKAEH